MIKLPSGEHLSERDANHSMVHNKESTSGTKRKASEISHNDKENDSIERPTTPMPEEHPRKAPRNDATPGRIGPIKENDHSVKPDIRPFKGPPGHKVRKTREEKSEEYRQFIRENENHMFHELYVCFDKGPNGSPTYDGQGFELDYEKVAEWMRPNFRRKPNFERMEDHFERQRKDQKRMAEIFFEPGAAPDGSDLLRNSDHWRDRVSKDLGVPWHKVWVKEFEEWERKGFPKAKKGEWQHFSEKEGKRILDLLTGASLRK